LTITPGKTWRNYIEDELKKARCISVIWSKESIVSEWVIEEAEYGKKAKTPIVPAMIEDVDPPFGFGLLQAARLTGWRGNPEDPDFDRYLKALKKVLGEPKEVRPYNIEIMAPESVKRELTKLDQTLQETIPAKQDDENLLIATWNLRNFGSLTLKWTSGKDDAPKRDLTGLCAISKIISCFDIVLIQEVTGDLRALRHMLHYLGHNWSFIMTDIALGAKGNSERMAFVFDNTRLQPSGLACELVVPTEWLTEIGDDALRHQFVRTPYAISFRRKDTTFILVTLHVDYGDSSAERIPELKGIAKWMADWARRSTRWYHNLLVLGDFNIDRQGDSAWNAFTSTGLTVPDNLNRVPRSIFDSPGSRSKDKFYDQIAWFNDDRGVSTLTMEYNKGGTFDFLPHVYLDKDLAKPALSYRISDHYPLWAEFRI
jgi:endonuclease/exonuclease/phosphatase family metal-dependent hydrolase